MSVSSLLPTITTLLEGSCDPITIPDEDKDMNLSNSSDHVISDDNLLDHVISGDNLLDHVISGDNSSNYGMSGENSSDHVMLSDSSDPTTNKYPTATSSIKRKQSKLISSKWSVSNW